MPRSTSAIHAYLRHIREMGEAVDIDLSRSGVTFSPGHALNSTETAPHWTEWVPECLHDSWRFFGTPGASGAVTAALLQSRLTHGPNATVAIETPGYPMFDSLAEALGLGVVRFARSVQGCGTVGAPVLDRVLERNAGKLALVCITDPHNPTGMELTADQAAALASKVTDAGATILIDRVFADFASDPSSYQSIDFSGYLTRSFSKSLGIGGLRFGWLAVVGNPPQPDDAIDVLFGQPMATAELERQFEQAWRVWDTSIEDRRGLVRTNTQLIRDWAARTDRAALVVPDAEVPYRTVQLDVPDAYALCGSAGVGVVPGPSFGLGADCVRIGLGGPTDDLRNGLQRLTDEVARN